jgi:uncharacterized membrane protein
MRWMFVPLALLMAVPAAAQPAPPPAEGARAPAGNPGMIRWRDIIGKLSPEGQRIVAEHVRAERQDNADNRARLQAARDRIVNTMAAEPFAADALRKAFADERSISATHQQRRHEATVAMLNRLSPADRKLVAADVSRMMQMGRMWGERIRNRMEQRGGGE